VEQLKQHAAELARKHRVSPERGRDRLLGRLSGNELPVGGPPVISAAVAQDQKFLPPASVPGQFYLIKEQIIAVRQHLPRAIAGNFRGCPRRDDRLPARI